MRNFASALQSCRWPSSRGTLWDYGHSTDVLGRVVEVISGKTLFQFEKERLLDPLGMSETAFYVADETKRRASPSRCRTTAPSARAPKSAIRLRREERNPAARGWSAPSAITRAFAQMLLNGGTFEGRRYLKPATIALMASDHIGPETKIARDYFYHPGANSGFGLGFAVRTSVPPNTQWPLGEIPLGRRRRHLFLRRSRRRHVCDLHGADAVTAWTDTTGALKTLIYAAMGR